MFVKRITTWKFIDDFSIVVQGPLTDITLESIDIYRKIFRKVIVSCWDNHTFNLPRHKNIRIIQSNYSELPSPTYHERQNELKQFYTTWKGLRATNTKYVLKVRSDEQYSNFDRFFTLMRENPNKLTTINTFFRTNHYMRYHISDHLLGGLTYRIWNMYNFLIRAYRKPIFTNNYIPHEVFGCRSDERFWGSSETHDLYCEQIACMSFLASNGIYPNSDNSYQIMQDNVQLVRLSEMGDFIGKSNSIGYQFCSENDMLWHRPRSITNMEEL